MPEITGFSEEVIQQIGHYVYLLVDPRDKTVFYVGKGSKNRVFQHEIDTSAENDDPYQCNPKKIQKIREIQDAGMEVERYVLRYGLEEEESYRLEAAVIDLLRFGNVKKANLLNSVRGHGSSIFGLQGVKSIEDTIAVGEVDLKNAQDFPDRVLCININNEYLKKGAYEAVRGNWSLSKKHADRAEYVLAEYKGIIVGVFTINEEGWQVEKADTDKTDKKRNWYSFKGEEVTDPVILDRYLHKRIKRSKGAQNPIRYTYK